MKPIYRVLWAYHLVMIAAQLLPWKFSLALGVIFTISGFIRSLRVLLLFGVTMLGHLLWVEVFECLTASAVYEPWLSILGRFGLMGYIFLLATWEKCQPCTNRYLRLGTINEKLKFPLVWHGFNEYMWRFLLIFCTLCLTLSVFFTIKFDSFSMILYGLLFASVNSVLEEILWRGFILGRAVDYLGEKQALIITSFAFGLYHLSLGFSVWICMAFAVGGFYMGGCAIKSKGISVSIIMHIFVNMLFVSLGMIF